MSDSPTDWVRGDWIQTFTGRAFYPLDPRPEDIDPADIAHSLSLQCRFGGHVRDFYSVAEHCVRMADAVAPEHALAALLHDATEAYVIDLPRPLKRMLPDYRTMEDRVWAAIATRFDVDPVLPPEVKEADNRILIAERNALLTPPPQAWVETGLEPLPIHGVVGWGPGFAEEQYERELARLTGGS